MSAPRVRRAGSGGVEDVLLAALGALVVVAGVLSAAGWIAAWVSGTRGPGGGLGGGLRVLGSPGDPAGAFGSSGLRAWVYWLVVVVLTGVVGVGAWYAWRIVDGHRRAPVDVHRIDGTARRGEVLRAAGEGALLRRARVLRPSLRTPRATDVGFLLGSSRGVRVWGSVEDSMLVVGPPRSGKGVHLVVNMVLDAPGSVVTTSTRPDTLAVTLRARERVGPVAVFDPQGLAPGVGAGVRWSPVRGCEDPTVAMIRANGLAAAVKFDGMEAGGFWQGKTRSALQCLLHAAALDGRSAADLYAWSASPTAARDAVRVLASAPGAAQGWAETLDATLMSDVRTRDSIWHGVSLAFEPLADPRILAAVSPRGGESFDPAAFLAERSTLFLLATGAGAAASAPLVAALIEDLVEVARHRAAASPYARLDPPLLLALDEIGNLAPLPSLPMLMAEGGGTGITVVPVLQSMAQARGAWGEQAAATIWDAAIVKVLLGGGSLTGDLRDVSTLLGERDELVESTTYDGEGRRSTQWGVRRVPVMPTETLRTLPWGTGLVLLRSARPIVADLRDWRTRADAGQLEADREAFAALPQPRGGGGSAPVV